MDPGQILRKEVQKNFPAFGSIRRQTQYHSIANSTYDADTRTVTPVENTNFPVKLIFGSIGNDSMDWVQNDDNLVLAVDKSAIVPALDMLVEPAINDEVVEVNMVWRVKGIKSDPATATWKLWLRPKDYDNTD